METKRTPLIMALMVCNLILIAAGLVACVFNVIHPDSGIWLRVGGVCAFFALLSAGYYVAKGYTKDSAKFFKLFNALYALSQLVLLIGVGSNPDDTLPIIYTGAVFGLVVIMVACKDLGFKRSLTICILIVIFGILDIITCAVRLPELAQNGSQYGLMLLTRNASQLYLSILFTIMTLAKYADKKSRGRDI